MPKSLFEKVWEAHTVRHLANGQTQLLIGTHLIHEVTSPQAFGMLRDLGLKVIAEGVETLDVLDDLAQIGCDMAQGYFIAKPMPLNDFSSFVKTANGVFGSDERQ